jgi:hypothetical protein
MWPPAPPWGTRAPGAEAGSRRPRDRLRRLADRRRVFAERSSQLVILGSVCLAAAVGLSIVLLSTVDPVPRPAVDEPPTLADQLGGAALGNAPDLLAGAVVAAPDDSFAITLPPEWRAGFVREVRRPIGEQMYPDDPTHSAQVEPLLPSATGETQMYGLAASPDASATLIPAAILQVDRHLVTGERTTSGAVDYIESWTLHDRAQILGQGTFATARGSVVWVEFQTPDNGLAGIRYLTTVGDWEWTVTYWTPSPAAGHTLADQIVASLTSGAAAT